MKSARSNNLLFPGRTKTLTKIHLLVLFFIHFSAILYSQDLTGRWKGKSYWPGLSGDTSTVILEIQKGSDENHFTGISVSVSENFYGKTKFHGFYNGQKKTYVFIEDGEIESNTTARSTLIFDKYLLTLRAGINPSLFGTIECSPSNGDINKTVSGCASKRQIAFLQTTESLPRLTKKSNTRIISRYVYVNNKIDTIWKAKVNLEWKDFKGTPDNKSEFGAVIFWNVDDKIDGMVVRNDTMIFKYTARAVMSDSSWVKGDQENSDLLKHEQGHFDIGRLCAREMEDSIRKTVFLQGEFPEKYIHIKEGILSKFQSMNRQYDDETNHFRNRLNQEKWDAFLNEKLYQVYFKN